MSIEIRIRTRIKIYVYVYLHPIPNFDPILKIGVHIFISILD